MTGDVVGAEWALRLRTAIPEVDRRLRADFPGARLLLSVEELGGGAQLVRYRCWPVVRRVTVGTVIAFAAGGALLWRQSTATHAPPTRS